MSNELSLHYTTGQTLYAIVWAPDRRYRWNGTAMVLAASIADTDEAWQTGLVTMTERTLLGGSTGTLQYVGDFPATGLVGSHQIDYYDGKPSRGDRRIGFQEVDNTTTATTSTDDADTVLTFTIRRDWEVDGVFTDPTSIVLSDEAGAYGIKETVSGTKIIDAGTGMDKISDGKYTYSFTAEYGTAYTAWVQVEYGGNTYRYEDTFPAVAQPDSDSMAVSFTSLQSRIARFAYGSRTITDRSAAEVLDIAECIKDGLRRVYIAHPWSFLRPVTTITTVDGTATYSLPTGYESIESKMHYAPGESDFYPPIRQRHDSEIRKRQQDDDEENRPLYFSIRTVEFDPTVGSRKQLVLYPTPDAEYVLYARMTLRPVMIDASNKYPIGGETLSQVITEACLAAAECNYDSQERTHTELLERLLPLAIKADLEASSPTTLGPDSPQDSYSDNPSLSTLIGDLTFSGEIL